MLTPQTEETYLACMFLVSLALVLGTANHPRGAATIYFNLGPEQAATQCLSGGIRALLAMAGAFGHGIFLELTSTR